MNSRLRMAFVIMVSPLLALALLYVGFGIAGMIRVHHAKEQAREDVRAHLAEAESAAEIQQQNARRERGREATSSSRRLECQVTPVEAGWISEDYVQECEIHTVDVFPGPTGTVETHTRVSRTSVGCAAWPRLFCGRPFEDPAVPAGVH